MGTSQSGRTSRVKNVETYIPAIVEQLSGDPDLSSLDEPVEVWISGCRYDLYEDFVQFFASEDEAIAFRWRFVSRITAVLGDPCQVTFQNRISEAKAFGLTKICQRNGKGEILRTWVVE